MAQHRRTFSWWTRGVLVLGVACGGPQPLGGEGAACVRAADCAPGLVCIEGACSADLSAIGADSTGPGGPGGGAGAPTGSSGGPSGGAPPVSTGGAPSGGNAPGGAAGSR